MKLVRDPSVAGHGSGSKDDIALALTIKEEEESSQFVLKTLMQDVEALAERLRLAIDNAKSGHSMPLQDLFDIIQSISVSRSNPNSRQPTTIITSAAKSQVKVSAEASPGEKTPPKDKKAKKAPRKSSSGSKAPPMPATSGALAAAMMAATAVAGGSKLFDEVTHKKAEDHPAPPVSAPPPTNDSGATEKTVENAAVGKYELILLYLSQNSRLSLTISFQQTSCQPISRSRAVLYLVIAKTIWIS